MRIVIAAAAAAAALAVVTPRKVSAQPVSDVSGPDTYLQLRAGGFFAQGTELDAFDAGFELGGTFGARFSPTLAAELGVGYLRMDGSDDGADLALWDVPVTANLRARAPLKAAELSVFGGLGLHFVTRSSDPDVGEEDRDTATTFGWQAGGELAFHLSPMMRVGVEGAYSWARPRVAGARIDLKGVRAAITLAYHF